MAVKKNPWLERQPPPRRKPKVLTARARELKQEPTPKIIQGKQADSIDEWYVALALDKLGLEYDYQYVIRYGRLRKGGQVLDFLVYTPGRWTVVDVRGKYWHTGRREDSLSLQRAVQHRNWNLVVVWGKDSPSAEATLSFLRSKLPHT